jgi:hypothetical protein
VTALAILISIIVLAAAAVCRPTHASCPIGYDLRTGIRRTGDFECWPVPVGDPDWDGTWQRPERSVQPDGVLEGRLYCTGGMQPLAGDDGRTVGCQR